MMQEQKDSPYKWSTYKEERKHMLLRTKFPRLTITLEDDVDEKQVADALKKAAEFLLKGGRAAQKSPLYRSVYRKYGELFAIDVNDHKAQEGMEFVGEVCEEECDTSCFHYCHGTCPYVSARMADGELVKLHDYKW